jgi:hypothetical protein
MKEHEIKVEDLFFKVYKFEESVSRKIFYHLSEQKKIGKVDGLDKVINDLVRTITVISSLGKDEQRILDQQGLSHNISEYEVCPQFERLCSSRGVYFDDSDFARNLKATSRDVWTKDRLAHEVSVGEEVTADDVNEADIMTLTVPCTPAEFRTAQVRVVNVMKGKIDHWTSINEVTKPITLSSVKVFMDGVAVSDPNGDWTEMPIHVAIGSDIYATYKFIIPIEEYADMFALHFVSDLG